jgi:opacity protein-like surface antigen
MKRSLVLAAGLAFFLAIQADKVEAQVSFGPQVVLFDFDEIGIGARVDIGLTDTFGIEEGFFEGLFASLNANYLLIDGVDSPLLINANANVPLSVDAGINPFVGAGINHYRFSSPTVNIGGIPVGGGSWSASGLNLLAGLFFDLGAVPGFAELQYSTTGSGFLSLTGGVLFGG